jgi:hypothetical protein
MFVAAHTNSRTKRLTETLLAKQFVEASVTIRFIVVLLESAFVQLLQTETTDKVFWMELAVHGGHTPSSDRLMTSGAKSSLPSVKVSLTIGSSVQFEESSG